MQHDYDAVIIGGAFSGAATALMLKRKRPDARVLIIEKTTEFDRKVGESTTELSSCYMTRILGLTHYLGHEQLAKQGLRMWFSNRADQPFDDCVEIGARYQTRLQTFQVDRAKLDSHLLELAVEAGCDLWRPAKVTAVELAGKNGQQLSVAIDGEERNVNATWVIDASGRAALARAQARLLPTQHRTSDQRRLGAFHRRKEWDNYEWRETFPEIRQRLPNEPGMGHQSSHGPRLVVLDHSACAAAMSAPVSSMTRESSRCQMERVSASDCIRTFSVIRLVAKSSARRKSSKTMCTRFPRFPTTARKSVATAGPRLVTRPVSSIRFTVRPRFLFLHKLLRERSARAQSGGRKRCRATGLLQRTIPDHLSVMVRDLV